MDFTRFGYSVGSKFNVDGSIRRFPGNTIISKITPDMPVFTHIQDINNMLRESDDGCVAFLPAESWHMTVMEGLCDQERNPAFWTTKLRLDVNFAETDKFLADAFANIEPLKQTKMVLVCIRELGGTIINLRPESGSDAENLRRYRDEFTEVSGIRFPRHDKYTFHISLGYGLHMPNDIQRKKLNIFEQRANDYIKKQDIHFILKPPVFTYFDDMLYFSEQPVAR